MDELLSANQVAICGPILTEIYRGFRSDKDRQKYLPLFEGCHFLSTPTELWRDAGLLGASLGKKGLTIKSFDLLIAVYSLAHNAPILSLDADFRDMQKAGIELKLS